MRMCKSCKWADLAEDREERFCRCHAVRDSRVEADAPACEHYAVSAWSFLESVAYAEKRLEDLSWRAQHYREMAGRATGSMEATRISGTGEASRVASNCDNCIDLAIQIDDQADRLRRRLELATRLIEDVDNPEERRVLELRHREYAAHGGKTRRKSWAEIAKEMCYDESSVRRIHRRALRQIQRQLDEMGVRE